MEDEGGGGEREGSEQVKEGRVLRRRNGRKRMLRRRNETEEGMDAEGRRKG